MSDHSIFIDKDRIPNEAEIKKALGKLYRSWQVVKQYAVDNGPGAEEWNYSKFGWNCRVKGKKSVIIYMMPCEGHFKASFVLGAKATTEALNSTISAEIKNIITNAKVYAEGRGIRIHVKNDKTADDIKKLIDIKLPSK